jgi:hypothetical protein
VTTEQIADLKRLEAEATPQPWDEEYVLGAVRHIARNVDPDCFREPPADPHAVGFVWDRYADGPYILAACRAVPALLAALSAAERERDEARFRPLGDNHHNAAACPYCSPASEIASLRARAAALEAERDENEQAHLVEELRALRENESLRALAARRGEALRRCLLLSNFDGQWAYSLDELGMEFYRATGIWPVFKSAPMEMHHALPDEERMHRWYAWLSAEREKAAAEGRAALSEDEGGARALSPEERR